MTNETTRKARAEITAYVEDALKMVVLTPQLSMFLGYFTSTLSGDIGPEWYDFCQVRAVCQRKSMREYHQCYPDELKPEERIELFGANKSPSVVVARFDNKNFTSRLS